MSRWYSSSRLSADEAALNTNRNAMTIRVPMFGILRVEKKKNALTSVLFLRTEPKILFDFDLSADFLELGLDVLGLFFGYALFDFRRYAFDQFLGFFQAQAGDGTYDFDHGDFASAGIGQYHIEFSLFFSSSSSTTTTRCTQNFRLRDL